MKMPLRFVRGRTLLILAVIVALAAGACSSDSSAAKLAAPTTTTLPPVFPLTGKPVSDPAAAARPATTVKIDNIAVARPQAGIDKADIVFEEFTEGITRFVVVFQSTTADSVGPVRSVRPADPTIVTPFGGVLAFSGGAPAIVELAKASPLTIVDENSADVMKRRSGRSAPHNLYTSTDGLLSKAPPGAPAPPTFANFLRPGQSFGGAGAVPITNLSVVPAPSLKADYEWDAASSGWKRATDGRAHALEGGGQIAPANVIIQFTPYSVFPPDPKVQFPEVVGTGEAWVFASGQMVKGRWTKSAAGTMTTFTDTAGAPIVLPPGQTWVHFVAPDAPVTPTGPAPAPAPAAP
ncbi:MAG TPA: DUF3048 domain-containing protein [Acidimicrobiales bacterium]|nr:DUF3048 domain-containing protein [Acidimicrobiales bacterium]